MKWRFSNLIILRDRRELIIRLDKVYCFTRGDKVGLRKSAQKLQKYQETEIRLKRKDLHVLVEVIVTAAQIYQRTLSHHDWPASLSSRPAMCHVSSPIHSVPMFVLYSAL